MTPQCLYSILSINFSSLGKMCPCEAECYSLSASWQYGRKLEWRQKGFTEVKVPPANTQSSSTSYHQKRWVYWSIWDHTHTHGAQCRFHRLTIKSLHLGVSNQYWSMEQWKFLWLLPFAQSCSLNQEALWDYALKRGTRPCLWKPQKLEYVSIKMFPQKALFFLSSRRFIAL